MSNLNSHYEISIWKDKQVEGGFEEQRVCVIGSDLLTTQSRALEPNFVRNVNGQKSLSFKMYKQYIDNITGQKTNNPFQALLHNETKVKLYYENEWHDFYVKNIVENSSTYLYTYQLGDALVQELSKNGYGVTFDAELNNNLGSAQELAATTLEDTDWVVEGSDVMVEKIEEHLIYARVNYEPYQSPYYAIRLKDQEDLTQGVIPYADKQKLENGDIILAFYSSCKNKPHRFQFIYLEDGYDGRDADGNLLVKTDENRIITEKDCQYYLDLDTPETIYKECESYSDGNSDSFYLPKGLQIIEKNSSSVTDEIDTTISNWYKGNRYGYAIKTVYVPQLNTYCGLYQKDGKTYYGYIDSKYSSPIFTQNVITNSEFKGTTGWVGTYCGITSAGATPNKKSQVSAQVECLYGRFNSQSKFVSTQDELKNGTYDDKINYTPYLKVKFQEKTAIDKGILINSGFYDNRRAIQLVQDGEKWCLEASILGEDGTSVTLSDFDIGLYEVSYDINTGAYEVGAQWGAFGHDTEIKKNIITIQYPNEIEELTVNGFVNKNIRLVISPKDAGYNKTYYIDKMEMYKVVLNDSNQLIQPGDLSIDGVVTNYYSFIEKDAISDNTVLEDISKKVIKVQELDYSKYVPIYNDGAQKIKTITIAESNYFNILQSIAETFECWLKIEVERTDLDNPGKITKKCVKFKNYAGNTNYASFRYGVNLKDIQRTFESKQLVTKLIVKQNNNELGQNGFCTIARANSNPTGENYIYDFQYFHNNGELNLKQYLADMYYHINPLNGITAANDNLQNYFNRVKKINNDLLPINEQIIDANLDLTNLNAEKTIQEGLRDAALTGIDESREKFWALTGVYPDQINTGSINIVECNSGEDIFDVPYNYNELNTSWDFTNFSPTFSAMQKGTEGQDKFNWNFLIKMDQGLTPIQFTVESFGANCIWVEDRLTCQNYYDGLRVLPPKKENTFDDTDKKQKYPLQAKIRYKLSFTLEKEEGELRSIGSHNRSFANSIIEIKHNGEAKTKKNTDVIQVEDSAGIYEVSIIGTYVATENDDNPWLFIQPNRGHNVRVVCKITNIKFERYNCETTTRDKTFYFQPVFTLTPNIGASFERKVKLGCKIKAYDIEGTVNYILPIYESSSTTEKSLTEYVTYKAQYKSAIDKLNGYTVEEIKDESGTVIVEGKTVIGLIEAVENKEALINDLNQRQKEYLDDKEVLNKRFYQTYSRFIQEGTWMSEDYADDDKYYNDALSVMYNSCYPQVQYTINVIALNKLPGYDGFKFGLGDTTYAEDPDFFGEDLRTEVVIMEIVENLDDASKNTIKVQNFKNQFQDLFQKITATVQQTQYNTGAYKKAVELAEANAEAKGKFISDGLSTMAEGLALAGQTSVTQGQDGITLTDSNTKNQMRLIGGAILMSVENQETGQRVWKTGLTPEGISASLITAGNINADEISIMNANEPTFKWNAFGISAFDTDWVNNMPNGKVNPYKFVRFDKYGIYGINSEDNKQNVAINGEEWHPESIEAVDVNSTFSLTWEGLKVTGEEGVEARIGKQNGNILSITKNAQTLLNVTNDGILEVAGTIRANNGYLGSTEKGWIINEGSLSYGQIGDHNSFILAPYGFTTDKIQIGSSDNDTTWVMTIDKKFGVANDGTMYAKNAVVEGNITATSGQIGNMTIGDINNKIVGNNLLPQGSKEEQVGRGPRPEFLKTSFDLAPIFDEYGLITYTLSFECCAATPGSIMVYCQNGNGAKYNLGSDSITIEVTEEYQKFSCTFIPELQQGNNPDKYPENLVNAYLAFYGTYGTGVVLKVRKLKLEKGTVATEWCPGEEDNLQSNVNNNFSWQFSPTTGIKMWNTTQGNEEIFCVDNNGLYIKGEISADTGSIGAWNIGRIDISENWAEGDATTGATQYSYEGLLYSKGTKTANKEHYLMYLRPNAIGTSSQVFSVRKKTPGTGKTSVKIDEAGYVETIFNITGEGTARMTSGYIGSWKIADGQLSTDVTASSLWGAANLKIGTSGIYFSGKSDDNKDIDTQFANNYLGFTDLSKRHSISLDASGMWLIAMTSGDTTKVCGFGFCDGRSWQPQGSSSFNAYLGNYNTGHSNYFIGKWQSQSSITTYSDIRYKNSITNFDEKYEMFFDQIQPRIYNLNFDNSQRHYGFIAQEILASLEFSGIDSAKCGLVPTRDNEEQYYALSYQEFIPLNTWQIQKLKPRLSAVEEEISQLKEKISVLETNLKI